MPSNLSNYPPGVTGSEPQIAGWGGAAAWEEWAENVKPGDRCQCCGSLATVRRVTPEFLWAIVDRQGEAQPFEWDDCEPLEPSNV